MEVLVTKRAFERWNEADKLRLIKKFRDTYNREKQTTFEIYTDSLIDRGDFDFTLQDPDRNILKVQHTLAGADPALEYVGEKLEEVVVNSIRKKLADLKNIYISIGFREILKTKVQAEMLAKNIEQFVRSACNNISPPDTLKTFPLAHFRYTDDIGPISLGTITSLLTRIDVYSTSGSITVSYGGPASSRLPDDLRASMAIGHKEGHYSSPQDLILLVQYNTPFFGEFFEPIIREQNRNSVFSEIWLFDAWKDRFVSVK